MAAVSAKWSVLAKIKGTKIYGLLFSDVVNITSPSYEGKTKLPLHMVKFSQKG